MADTELIFTWQQFNRIFKKEKTNTEFRETPADDSILRQAWKDVMSTHDSFFTS